MRTKLFRIIFTLAIAFTVSSSFAQIVPISPEEIQKELENRGLTEDDVKEKLLKKGIDAENVDPNNAEEVEKALQQVVEETKDEAAEAVEDVATKKVQESVNKEVQASANEIERAVSKGKSLEEAIAEEVTDAAKTDLPPVTTWGQQLFREKGIAQYNSATNIKPPKSYVLGPGDEIVVSIWGASEFSNKYEIEDDGYIKPSKMQRIYLKGVTLEKAEKLVKSRFAQNYRFGEGEFGLSLNYSRTVTVNVVGEALNIGAFTVPAVNTAFNVLVAAGGPSDIGSLRNITLYRAGEKPRSLDVYEYILNPSISKDYFLQNNDYLHIGIAEKVVAIQGAVKRSAQYELKQNENLKKLIEWAGGLIPNAYQDKIQITRFVDDKQVVEDINLRDLLKSGKDYTLFPGDRIIIPNIPKPYKNFVEISGAVDAQGVYELAPNMKLSELVKRAVLSDDARTDIAYISRLKPDLNIQYIMVNIDAAVKNPNSVNNILLQPKDKLLVYSKSKFTEKTNVSISGEVRNPGSFEYNDSLHVSDLVTFAGGLKESATKFAYIYRKDPNAIKPIEYVRVNLEDAVENPSSSANVLLRAHDDLVIYNNAKYSDSTNVIVTGAVRQAVNIQYDQSLNLKDVLTMAGGLRPEADLDRVQIYRLQINEDKVTTVVAATVSVDDNLNVKGNDATLQLQPYDMVVVRPVRKFKLQRKVLIKGEIEVPGEYVLLSDNEQVSSVLERAGGLTVDAFVEGATLYRKEDDLGYIVIKLDEVLKDKASRYNFILREGDVIEVPKQRDFVVIQGATNADEKVAKELLNAGNLNVAYYPGKNAKWYVDNYAGGIDTEAGGRRALVSVTHPNGKLERTRNYGLFKKYPSVEKGSVITVGAKKKEEKPEGESEKKVDWGEVFTKTLAQATAIITLIVLIQRVD
jgi:protein involved in polysaccharide export with SLBB domain